MPKKAPAKPSRAPKKSSPSPRLLSGDNPQIPKADGDAPVQAYIAAIPGWKQGVARQLDTLISTTIPHVRKAVKWNTPFYGSPPSPTDSSPTWFLAFHCYTNYLKLTFFRGISLHPIPPIESKTPETRYLHLHEADLPTLEPQLKSWILQASKLPGEKL